MNPVIDIASAVVRSGLLAPPAPWRWPGVAREIYSGPAGLTTLFRVSAARWPARTALVDDEGALTYRQLLAEGDAAASALHRTHGIGPGSTVGVLCRNSRHFVVTLLASARLGADVLLLNTDFRGRPLATTLENHAVSIVVADDEFLEIVREIPATEWVSPSIRAAHAGAPAAPREGRLILLTSGTTGSPRGVPRDPDVASMLGMAASVISRTGARVGFRTAVAVPFFHAFGLAALLLTLSLGGTVITQARFHPETALRRASANDADALTVVPAMLGRILEADARPALVVPRVVLSGGSALLPALAERFTARFGGVLFNGYGSSEVALATLATPDDLRRAPGTVGRPITGTTVRILDDAGAEVPVGATGRVFVGGAAAVSQYTGGPGKPRAGSLIASGDTGRFDRNGLLHIAGREDDMIVSGGENVYPRALENALAAHEAVSDSCALGVPDEHYGERLVALVSADYERVDQVTLREYLRASLARFEQPRDIYFVDSIPRNAAGKVDRTAAGALLVRLMTAEAH